MCIKELRSLTSVDCLISDCPIAIFGTLPYIDGPITCNLGSTCTSVTCCVHTEPLSRHLNLELSLNHCLDKLTIMVDKYSHLIKISQYQHWGTTLYYVHCKFTVLSSSPLDEQIICHKLCLLYRYHTSFGYQQCC